MAYSPRQGLPKLGQTYYKGSTPPTTFAESAPAEGTMAIFKDTQDAGAVGADTARSNHDRVMRLVRNTSGATLSAKRLVSWAAGYIGKRVDGYTDLDYDLQTAGVIDEKLSGGCPANDLCWITVQGPTLVKNGLEAADSSAVAENAHIAALTGANSTAVTSGRIQAFASSSSITVNGDRIRGIIGRALSARTSANTDSDVLCFVDLLKA